MTLLKQSMPTDSPQEKPKAESRFRPDVEGLRAVAVALVVLYHAGVPGIRGGYIGVDVFFVISGYLITGILLRESASSGSISLLNFYSHRIRRILPAAMLTILGTVIASHYLENFLQSYNVAVDARWASGFLANFRFMALGTNYLTSGLPPSPLQHFWSLAVEEQFYVLWPLALLVIAKIARSRSLPVARVAVVVLTATSLVWCVLQTHNSATVAYFSPLTRGWELGLGCAVAAFATPLGRIPRRVAAVGSWVGLTAIVVSAFVYDESTAFPGFAALLPVGGTAVVIAAGLSRVVGQSPAKTIPSAERLLALKPLQFIGRYSYSLYLVHYPILIIAAAYAGHALSLQERLLLVAASVVVARLMSLVIENPVRRSSALRRSTASTIWLAVVVLVVPLTVAQGFVAAQNRATTADAATVRRATPLASSPLVAPATAADVRAAVASAVATKKVDRLATPLSLVPTDHWRDFTDGCHSAVPALSTEACVFGDTRAARTIVLFGDSHAAQWLPALATASSRTHYRVILMSKSSCPIASMRSWDYLAKHEYTECEVWHKDAMAKIAKIHPTLVVVANVLGSVDQAVYGSSDAQQKHAWLAGVSRTLGQLKTMANNVAYLADTPQPQTFALDCVASHMNDLGFCSTPVATAVSFPFRAEVRQIAKQSGAHYVETLPWFCTASTCPDVIHKSVVVIDSNHIAATYTTYLSGVLATSLKMHSPASAVADGVVGAVLSAATTKSVDHFLTPLSLVPDDQGGLFSDGCLALESGVTLKTCTYGDTNATRTIVLFGDSHAAQWLPPLADAATRLHYRLVLMLKASCSIAAVRTWDYIGKHEYTNCEAFHTDAMARIAKIHPALVVAANIYRPHGTVDEAAYASQPGGPEQAWLNGIGVTLAQLKTMAGSVAYLADTPTRSTIPIDCVASHLSDLNSCTTPIDQAVSRRRDAALSQIATKSGALYVQTRPWFCTASTCPDVIHKTVVTFDAGHMAKTYAMFLTGVLSTSLKLTKK